MGASSIALPSLHESFEKSCQAKVKFFFAPVFRATWSRPSRAYISPQARIG